MPFKFYGVFRGRHRGVFESWAEVERVVTGFKGARYRGFSSRVEAERFAATGQMVNDTTRQSQATRGGYAVYTDGGCIGNINVAKYKNQPAGWAVVVRKGDETVDELYGPVELNASSPNFLGAELCSNNTGELSAIAEALIWLQTEASGTPACIYYDSKYAANITTRVFRAQRNRELAKRCQSLCDQVKASRVLDFIHVKGHQGNDGNERADELVRLGIKGKRTGRRNSVFFQSLPKRSRSEAAIVDTASVKKPRGGTVEEKSQESEAASKRSLQPPDIIDLT